MKKLINILATVVLATSSMPFLAKQYITTKLQDTPKQYQEQAQNYDVVENPNHSSGEEYSKTFQNWINGEEPVAKGHYNAWDSYLHQFNESGNTKGVNPIKATVGGGIFLNQSGGTGSPTFSSQYANDDSIGSFAYNTYQKTAHDYFNHKTPQPSQKPYQGATSDGGYDGTKTDLTTNDLTPQKNPTISSKTKESNEHMNNLINGYLTAILNYWYYTYFGDQIRQSMDPGDYNLKRSQYVDFYNNVINVYLNNLLYFEFGVKWNDKEKVSEKDNTYKHIAENFVDLLIDGATEFAEFGAWGAVGAWAFEAALGWLLDSAQSYAVVDHQFKYISDPLSLSIIQNIFRELLGDGTGVFPAESVIKKFITNNGVYPDSLTVKNFDFNVQNYSAYNEYQQNYEWEATQTAPSQYSWEDDEKGSTSSTTNINTTKITPHISMDIVADKATPSYDSAKERIDNLGNGSKSTPFEISTNDTTVPGDKKDWQQDQIKSDLDGAWGLGDFEQYVTYEPTTLIPNKPVIVKLICPLLGYTENHPRYFYVEAY